MQIWWSNPYKMWFFGRSVTQIFFGKYVFLSVSKLYTKLSKTAILEHPYIYQSYYKYFPYELKSQSIRALLYTYANKIVNDEILLS